jgi:hypothetical protein
MAPESQSAPQQKKKAKPASKARPQEEVPVLSGRMVVALTFVVAMVVIPVSPLGRLMGKTTPKSEDRQLWQVGKSATIHITVTTADYDKLACADPRVVAGSHCAFKSEKEPFPHTPGQPIDDNKKTILQPYRTTDSQLLYLPALWTQPEVAMRLHNEPARGVSETKLARFVVSCDVDFLEEWETTLLRWGPRESWTNQGKAMVARPKKCQILVDSKS